MASIAKRTRTGTDGKLKTTYQVRWKQIDGKEKRKDLRTRREADEWRRKVERLEPRRIAITGVMTSARTIEDAMREYLDGSKTGLNGKPPVEASTLLTMETLSRSQICDRWGHISLQEMTPKFGSLLRDQLISDQNIKRSYQKLIWRHFKACMNYMTFKGVFAASPLDGVSIFVQKATGAEEDEVQMPTLQEAKAIVDLAREWSRTTKNKKSRRNWKRAYTLIRLGFETGLRIGELAALPLKTVDLDKGTIKVIQTAQFNVGVIGKPKTPNAYREIALTNKMKEELGWYIDEVRHERQGDLVFGTQSGDFIRYNSLRSEMWVPLLKELGYVDNESKPKYTPHSMRHFRASALIRAGVGHLAIKKELGHSKIEITLNLYGHLFKDDEEARREKNEEINFAIFG